MAVKAKKSAVPSWEETVSKTVEAMNELLTVHGDEIGEAINESEDRCLTVGLKMDLDCSESAPKVTVSLRFTPSTVTDNRTIQMDDPAQGKLEIYTNEELAAQKAKAEAEAERAAKKAAKEAERKAEIEAEEARGKKES